jgi:hypothetical protein
MSIFFRDFRELWQPSYTPKEKHMAKTNTKVAFTGGEYKPQRLASGWVGFRAPVDVQIAPGQTANIDLRMVCSVGLSFQSRNIEPGQNIVINVLNTDNLPLRFTAGEVFTRAFPLIPVDYDIE